VEIGLLLDAHARFGLSGLAQVNLGVRKHRNRSLLQLGVMARQILGTALARCDVTTETSDSASFTQFVQVAGEWLPDTSEIALVDRPPIREVSAVER
jgi:glucosyl-3-phosphoglycerate synthase